jgi:hypothetical protein
LLQDAQLEGGAIENNRSGMNYSEHSCDTMKIERIWNWVEIETKGIEEGAERGSWY